jgi:hypothetical protein
VNCEDSGGTCGFEYVPCIEGNDCLFHMDVKEHWYCREHCDFGFIKNVCKDTINEGDECVTSGSFCKDNVLYECKSGKYRAIDCGAYQRTCVYDGDYWAYCLDMCTEEEYNANAMKIQCANNYYSSSFNQSYDSPANSQFYIELYCVKNNNFSDVYNWDWKDTLRFKECPGICIRETNMCKVYEDLEKACSSDASAPEYYPNTCDGDVLLFCDFDGTVKTSKCEVCTELNGKVACYLSCDPESYKDSTICYRHNKEMSYETDEEIKKSCVAAGDKYIINDERRYCEAQCDEETNLCGVPPVYQIGDPCDSEDFWIRCQDETHRFVCTDDAVTAEACPSGKKCKNDIFYGHPLDSRCVDE